MALTDKDRETCYFALRMWANYIESGNPDMSAIDALSARDLDFEKRWGRARARPGHGPPRVLSTEQMREVVRLRDLADAMLAKSKG